MERVKFDEKRFRNGEVAFDRSGVKYLFERDRGGYFLAIKPDDKEGDKNLYVVKGEWLTMLPPAEEESPWIAHDGGDCPIPWAKAGSGSV